MGGRITVESVVRCLWNGWPDDRGIRRLCEMSTPGVRGMACAVMLTSAVPLSTICANERVYLVNEMDVSVTALLHVGLLFVLCIRR